MIHKILLYILILCSSFSILGRSTKEADNFAISKDGSRIKYDLCGKGNPAIIFIHGWGGNKSYWKQQLNQFSNHYKVLAIDLSGFGESDNRRTNWTMARFGEDVIAVIDKLSSVPILVE